MPAAMTAPPQMGDGVIMQASKNATTVTPMTPKRMPQYCLHVWRRHHSGVVEGVWATVMPRTPTVRKQLCRGPMRDGIIYTGIEECDDGNTADNDACRNDCTLHGVATASSAGVEECDINITADNVPAAAAAPCTMWRRHHSN